MVERKGSHAFGEAQGNNGSSIELQSLQSPFSISNLLSYNKYLDESTLTQL